MHDPWIDRLSEHVDGELSGEAEAALVQHLRECARCREAVVELQQVRQLAAAVQATPPATDLWPGIAARIAAPADVVRLEERRPRRWHVSFTVPQLAAAAVVLMALSGGAVWFATGGSVGAPTAAAPALTPERPPVLLASSETAGYERAISELQQALRNRDQTLDSTTVAVLRHSLATIDAAIADARAALEQDPSNPFLYHHLDGTMKKKVEILRRAVSARRAAS